jgi:putative aldouronate transport system permease protein
MERPNLPPWPLSGLSFIQTQITASKRRGHRQTMNQVPVTLDPKRKLNEKKGFKGILQKCAQQKTLLLMCIPFIIWVLIFRYVPIWGWIMVFQDYRPALGIFESEWVGFKHFVFLFTDSRFLDVLRNTLAMSLIQLVFMFVSSIGLAVLLNEIRHVAFKRIVQTVSYMPYFLSMVVAASIISYSLSVENGIINIVLAGLNIIKEPIMFLGVGEYFWWIFGLSDTWKNVGFNTIIYLAAIAMIDQEQNEAAQIDGASRIQRIFYVTIPSMSTVIVILLIMNIGWIIESGFQLQLLLMNPLNREFAEVIDIFVLEYGIGMGNFSLATAAGIFKTVVCVIMLLGANEVSKRLGGPRLF